MTTEVKNDQTSKSDCFQHSLFRGSRHLIIRAHLTPNVSFDLHGTVAHEQIRGA